MRKIPSGIIGIVMSETSMPYVVPLSELDSNGELAGEAFVEQECEDWLGFYDWLRADENIVVGVDLVLDPPARLDLKSSSLKCVSLIARPEWKEYGRLTIFFTERREYVEALSADQAFGGNRLFYGKKGSVILTFEAPPGDEFIADP